MSTLDQLSILVNTFGSALISVAREMNLETTLNKTQVAPGVKVQNICVASLIGIVGGQIQGTAVIMLDPEGFEAVVTAMSGGMIAPDIKDAVAMSVIGELSNMVSGRALIQSAIPGMDVTPPQLLVGENIQSVPSQSPGVKCFTLPFTLQSGGKLFLVLSFNAG